MLHNLAILEAVDVKVGVVLTGNPDLRIGHHIITWTHHLKDKVIIDLILHQIILISRAPPGQSLDCAG